MTENIWQQQTDNRARWVQEIDQILLKAALPDRALRRSAPVPQGAERWDWAVTGLCVAAIGIAAVWSVGLVLAVRWAWEAWR